MHAGEASEEAVNEALGAWRQGDVTMGHGLLFIQLASHSDPQGSGVSLEGTGLKADYETVPGLVVVSHDCDIVREVGHTPVVDMAPLVEVGERVVEETRLLKRTHYAYLSGVAELGLVVDLDRTMSVSKRLLARWTPVRGCLSEKEGRAFARALARKRERFALPDAFQSAITEMSKHLRSRHPKQNAEGAHLRALREIRVGADPSWEREDAKVRFWFIHDREPEGCEAKWHDYITEWMKKIDESNILYQLEKYRRGPLREMNAEEYIATELLDYDSLSVPRRKPKGPDTG